MVFLRHQFSVCQQELSRKGEAVAFCLNNNRWRLTVNWCQSWSQMNYAGDKMERWRNDLCLLISFHPLLLSPFIKCCHCALIVLGLIESVNLPFNMCCDQSQRLCSEHPSIQTSPVVYWNLHLCWAWNNKFSVHCDLIATECLQAFKRAFHI